MQLKHPDIARTCKESVVYEEMLRLDGAAVLELGCGKADHTRQIARAHPTATIVAAEVDARQHAKNLASERPGNMTFVDWGAQKIGLGDATVDVVMMFKSLHHVPAELLDTAFAEIRRVLKPGGLAYVSEPIFGGEFNELIRIFNDEEVVRQGAFDAVVRAVASGRFSLVKEEFFLVPVHYRDFAEFEKRHFIVTFAERNVTDEQAARVKTLFESHLGADGVRMTQQMRVDLLRAA
jgi:SAM-dependent methyltransferase